MLYRLTFLLLITLSCQQAFNQEQKEVVTIIDIATFKETVIDKEVQLIDIRTPEEYANGYIDDAVNIPIADKTQFITDFSKLDKEKPVYIYCYSGVRSHRAGKLLKELGFTAIYDFKGGWKVWSSQ